MSSSLTRSLISIRAFRSKASHSDTKILTANKAKMWTSPNGRRLQESARKRRRSDIFAVAHEVVPAETSDSNADLSLSSRKKSCETFVIKDGAQNQ